MMMMLTCTIECVPLGHPALGHACQLGPTFGANMWTLSVRPRMLHKDNTDDNNENRNIKEMRIPLMNVTV